MSLLHLLCRLPRGRRVGEQELILFGDDDAPLLDGTVYLLGGDPGTDLMPAADAHGLCAALAANVHPLLLGAALREDDVADLEELLVHVSLGVQEAGGHDDAPPRVRLQEVIRGCAELHDRVGHAGAPVALDTGAGHALLVRDSQAYDARAHEGGGCLPCKELLEEGLVLL